MSAVHTVATKNANNEAAASPNHKNTQVVPEIIPDGKKSYLEKQILIQRKENTCACGGGCPRCKEVIQPKLKIGQPDDVYEQEADRVADQVMRMPEPVVSPKPA